MGGCDESKCVSKGRSDLHNDSFTCYGDDDGTFYPMMCADGYLPLVVEDEVDSMSNVTNGEDGSGNVPVSYFTCCPPQHHFFPNSTDVVRRCSNPITVLEEEWEDDEIINAICEDDWKNQTYAFRMKAGSQRGMGSFLCCDSSPTDEYNKENFEIYDDSIEDNATIFPKEDFLEDLECVPYRNEYYQASNAHNQIGATNAQNEVAMLRPISCDTPERNFLVPRPFGNETIDDVASTGRYQCCRDGPSLPPFAPDYAFRITLYPAFGLFCVAAILSAIAVVGLLFPLLIQLGNGTFRKPITESRQREPRYNTYNLYLVYLMAVDLVYCLFQVSLYGRTIQQKFHPGVHGYFIPPTTQSSLILDPFVEQPYFFVSLWLNCIVCFEILQVLKCSRSGPYRIQQPSLRRVNAMAGVTCIVAVIIGSLCYYFEDAIQKAELDGNIETQQVLLIVFLVVGTVLVLPPILYILNGSCIIWWRGYIPSLSIGGASDSDMAMREFAFYFFRIVVVFLGMFLPVTVLSLHATVTGEISIYAVTSCLVAIKPTLTFFMILTKTDARNYILQLVTLSFLFGDNSCMRNRRKEAETTQNKTKTRSRNRSKTSRTTKIPYGDSNRDGAFTNNGANGDKKHGKEDAEARAGPENKGRYIYTSRRIPGIPAAILPTGQMVSLAVSPGIRSTETGTNTDLSDEEEILSMAVSPGISSIETARSDAEFSFEEQY